MVAATAVAIVMLSGGGNGDDSAKTSQSNPAPTYIEFLTQVESRPSSIVRVHLNLDDDVIEVIEVDGAAYRLDYPTDSENALIRALRTHGIEVD